LQNIYIIFFINMKKIVNRKLNSGSGSDAKLWISAFLGKKFTNYELLHHYNFLAIKDPKTKQYHNFHYIWLRHNCPCEIGCHHPITKERTINLIDIPMDITPSSALLKDNNTLDLKWKEGETIHSSSLNLQFLLNNSYSKTKKLVKPPPNEIKEVELDYQTYRDSGDLKLFWKLVEQKLKNYYFIIVRNRGLETEEIIKEYGGKVIESHFGRIEDLKTNNTTNKNTDQLGYTNSAVNLHTDLPFRKKPPGMQLLHCIQHAEIGGENFFVNSVELCKYMKYLDPKAFKILSSKEIILHRKQKNFEVKTATKIITLKNTKVSIVRSSYFTYAPFNYKFTQMEKFYNAHSLFSKLAMKYRYETKLNKGDYVLYNNHKMMHARREFQGDRHMRGIYFDSKQVFKAIKQHF
jgi:hypothetical protein